MSNAVVAVPDWWPAVFLEHVEVFDAHFPTLGSDAIGRAIFALPEAAAWRTDPEALLTYWRSKPVPTTVVAPVTRFD